MILLFMLVSLLNCLYYYEHRAISDSTFALLACFLMLMYYEFALFIRSNWQLRIFRGPFALPIIGNCYQPSIRSLLRYLALLRKQYGKIFKLYMFRKAYLVVLDPVIVRRILSDNKVFVADNDVSRAFSGVFGPSSLMHSEVITPRQRDVKNIITRILCRHNISSNIHVMNFLAREAVDDLVNEKLQWMHNFSLDKFSVRVDHFFTSLTMRIFMHVAMNADLRNDPEKERKLCSQARKGGFWVQYLLCATHTLPWWLLAPVRCILALKRRRTASDIFAFVEAKYQERYGDSDSKEKDTSKPSRISKMTAEERGRDDFLSAIKSGELTMEEVADHMISLAGAGQDTSSYFASFACLLLANNPRVQDKLRESITNQLGDRQDVTLEDISQLSYLHDVLREVMRCYAVVPNVLRRSKREVTIKDCSMSENTTHFSHLSDEAQAARGVNDITIPAGTNLLIPFYLMNRDPSVWPDPSAFRPERFEQRWGLNTATSPKNDYSNARAGFYPFGYGNRTCPGAVLVQTEVAVMLCHLLRKVVLTPEKGFKCAINAATLLTPTNGVVVSMSPIRNETPLEMLMR